MHRLIKQLVMLCLLVVPATAMGEGFVQTADGKRIEGTIALERGKFIVKQGGGGEAIVVPFENVKRASFGRQKSAAPAVGKEIPNEPLKAKTVEGLRGEYFADHKMTERKLVRVDRELNLWWGSAPDPAVPKGFAVRWTGQLEAKFSERYTFEADLIGGMRMWIDEKIVVDQWDARPGNVTGFADLKAGHQHGLRIEFHDAMWAGLMRLFWLSEHQSRQVVPASQFHPPTGTVVPAAAIRAPREGPIFRMMEAITLEGDSDDPGNRLDFFVDDAVIGTIEKRPWKVQWARPGAGYHKAVAQATNAGGISSMSEARNIAVAGDANGALPQPWMEMPVGKLAETAAVSWENRRLTMQDSFGNLWSQGDGFRYVFQPIDGDGSIVARMEKFDASNEEASAGLLIRENHPSTRARGAFVGVAREGLMFRRCENYWQEPLQWDEKAALPCWFKLSRYGNDLRAYWSADGKDWNRISALTMDLPRQVMMGFAVASPGREPSKGIFDKISLSGGPPQMMYRVKGVILRDGSTIGGLARVMDDSSVKLVTVGGEVAIPRSEVARIVFQPLTSELAEGLSGARKGLLMSSGDFVDGDVETIADSSIRLSSVLFGARKQRSDEVIVAVLRETSPRAGALQVELVDGSIIQASDAKVEGDRLAMIIGSGTNLSVVGVQVAEIRRQ